MINKNAVNVHVHGHVVHDIPIYKEYFLVCNHMYIKSYKSLIDIWFTMVIIVSSIIMYIKAS